LSLSFPIFLPTPGGISTYPVCKRIVAPANSTNDPRFLKYSEIIGGKETGTVKIPKGFQNLILKNIFIWFSPGCRGIVHVKIADRGGDIIPDSRISLAKAVIGDDIEIPFTINKPVKEDDEFSIYTKNLDINNDHLIQVRFTFAQKSTAPNVGQINGRKSR